MDQIMQHIEKLNVTDEEKSVLYKKLSRKPLPHEISNAEIMNLKQLLNPFVPRKITK